MKTDSFGLSDEVVPTPFESSFDRRQEYTWSIKGTAGIRHRMPPLAIEQDTEPAVKVYSWDEIRKHDKEGDAWVVKGGQVTLHRKGA